MSQKELSKFLDKNSVRQFIFYFHFVGWDNINLGLSINILLPNLELHIPFGFIRIGFVKVRGFQKAPNSHIDIKSWGKENCYGLTERYYWE